MWCQNCGQKSDTVIPITVTLPPIEDEEDCPPLMCCAMCVPLVCARRKRMHDKLIPWFSENFTQKWVPDGGIWFTLEWVWKW